MSSHAARKQIDTQFNSSGFGSQLSQGRHLPQRRLNILTLFNEKQADTSLSHFLSSSKVKNPSRAHKWLGLIFFHCVCFIV